MCKISYYNTCTGKYEIITVTTEVADFINKSHWREVKQEERYKKEEL